MPKLSNPDRIKKLGTRRRPRHGAGAAVAILGGVLFAALLGIHVADMLGAPAAEATLRLGPPEAAPAEAVATWLPAPPPIARRVPAEVALPATPDLPMIAIVIDDMGMDRKRSARAARLPGPLTLAFLTYAGDLGRQTAAARRHGHELLAHVPMEPAQALVDPGPGVLLTGHDRPELLRRLRWDLARFDGYVGVNNHMGSRFTGDREAMRTVLREIKARGLLYLDSRTTAATVAPALAAEIGVAFLSRDRFIDNVGTPAAIRAELATLEELARLNGAAIGIGHPRDATLDTLEAWLPEMRRAGFRLVPVSAILRRTMPMAGPRDRDTAGAAAPLHGG